MKIHNLFQRKTYGHILPGVDKGTVNCELGKFCCELEKLETVKNCENHVNCEIGFTVTVKWK